VFGGTRRNADAMRFDPIRDNTESEPARYLRSSSAKAGPQRLGVASLHFVGFVKQELISAHRHYAALRNGRVPS
jgi:hypothetical protein